MKKTIQPFWILWNPQGSNPPTVRFATYEAAEREAERMQTRIGVGTMYIMQAVGSLEISLAKKWARAS